MADLVRAVRRGGYLLISVPHAESLLGIAEDALRRVAMFTRRAGSRHLAFSLRRYRRDRFEALLDRLGVAPLAFKYFETPLPTALGVATSSWRRAGVPMLAAR